MTQRIISLSALFVVWAVCGALPVTVSADTAGSVSGTVEVKTRGFFGGLRNRDENTDVLVYITGYETPPPTQVVELIQRGKTFIPKIVPIVKGQAVVFPNQDDIYHNVFSVSPVTSFDLGQYKRGDTPKEIAFTKTGLIPVYCNIHPQMIAYIAVLENDGYDITDKKGHFRINGVPPGQYTLNAWTYSAKRVSQPITIKANQTTEVSMTVQQITRETPHKRKDNTEYPKSAVYIGD